MRSLLGLSAGLTVALTLALPALAGAQSEIGQIEVGEDTLALEVDQTEALTYYVTTRTRSGRLIRAPQLAFTSLDTSIVRMTADTAYGVQPGTALVVVRPATGSRPVRDTLVLAVSPTADAPGPQREQEPDSAPAGPEATMPPEPPSPGMEVLAKLPAGTVLAPEPNPVPLLLSERETVSPVVRRQGDNGVIGTVRAGWQSLSPGIVLVDSGGNVTAVGVGTGVVQVTPVGGASRTVSVTVDTARIGFLQDRLAIPVGEQRTPGLVVPRQGNRRLDNLKLTWRSSNESIAMVGADGTLTGRAPGRAEIVASGFLRADTLPVIVHPPVASLSKPKANRAVVVPLRGTVPFTVTPLGVGSDTVTGIPIVWTVGDTSVIGFDSVAQTISGRAVGSTRLSLQVEGFKPSSWIVSVVPPGVALDRERMALSKGARQTLVANMVDRSGRSLAPLLDGRWHSSDPAVAAVNSKGVVTAKALGRTQISITGPAGRSDTTEVFVVGDLLVASDRQAKRPGIYQVSLSQPDSLVPLLADAGIYLGAVYSPDRTRIALSSTRDKSLTVSVMEAGGGGAPRPVLRVAGATAALAWMPDGSRLVFAIGTKQGTTMGLLDVHSVTWDTLARSEGGLYPDVSRDGTIAYAAGDKKRSEIYTLKPGAGPATRLTNTPARKSHPRWLPDGNLLFIAEDSREKERFRIIRYNPKTGNQAPIVTTQAPILFLSVSSDGNSMAYLAKGLDKKRRFSLMVRSTAPEGAVRQVGLRPDEVVTALSF